MQPFQHLQHSPKGTILDPKNINLPHFLHLADSFGLYLEQGTKTDDGTKYLEDLYKCII